MIAMIAVERRPQSRDDRENGTPADSARLRLKAGDGCAKQLTGRTKRNHADGRRKRGKAGDEMHP